MAKAHLTTKVGTTITIEGTEAEIADLITRIEGSTSKSNLSRKTEEISLQPKSKKAGPKFYVEELIDEDFFAQKRRAEEVISELADRGHHIAASDVRVYLLRFCKSRQLRRRKEEKSYLYSNW